MEGAIALRPGVRSVVVSDRECIFYRAGAPALRLELPTSAKSARNFAAALTQGLSETRFNAICGSAENASQLLAALRSTNLLAQSNLEDVAAGFEQPWERIVRYFAGIETPERSAADAMRTIRAARVMIIGAGSLGSYVIQHLVGVGTGTLSLVDFDAVEESNLSRQSFYLSGDVGAAKVIAAARRIECTGLGIACETHSMRIGSAEDALSLLDAAGRIDVIVLTADAPRWKLALWVQAAAHARGIPLMRGSALGAGPFVLPGAGRGCLGCEFARIRRDMRMAAEEILDDSRFPRVKGGALGAQTAITAARMCEDVVHHLAGLGSLRLISRRMSASSDRADATIIERDRECHLCHVND